MSATALSTTHPAHVNTSVAPEHGCPLCPPQTANCEVHEAGTPEPHRNREQAGRGEDTTAEPGQLDEAERMLVAEYYQRVFGEELPESVVAKG